MKPTKERGSCIGSIVTRKALEPRVGQFPPRHLSFRSHVRDELAEQKRENKPVRK
jgi:hypothetical protein